MKLSMVIPCYSATRELAEMAIRCASSYRDQVDEMIIVEDSDRYWPELHALADHYLLHKKNLQHCANTNVGWRMATGDYVAIVNSDTYLVEGDVRDLCVPDTVTSPAIPLMLAVGGLYYVSGAFFVVPKDVYLKYGMYDENSYKWEHGDTLVVYHYPGCGVPGVRIDTVKVHHENASMGPSYRVRGVKDEPTVLRPDQL